MYLIVFLHPDCCHSRATGEVKWTRMAVRRSRNAESLFASWCSQWIGNTLVRQRHRKRIGAKYGKQPFYDMPKPIGLRM